jgi:hypothetical protein
MIRRQRTKDKQGSTSTAPESIPGFFWIRVSRSLIFCEVFCWSLFVLRSLSSDHCTYCLSFVLCLLIIVHIVCPSFLGRVFINSYCYTLADIGYLVHVRVFLLPTIFCILLFSLLTLGYSDNFKKLEENKIPQQSYFWTRRTWAITWYTFQTRNE